ncbi:MAG: hypothetical protein QOI41_2904 [Myxococcales bacterium]|nr:hypothetical protein [Myxococcales bacterium]
MRSLGVLAALSLLACTKPSVDAGAPHLTDDPAARSPSLPAASAAAPVGSAPPDASVTSTSDAGADASSAASDETPVKVKLATIGMHVGGGPYDEITKEPIKRSVEPHFTELARCWKHLAKQQPTDVGVDLVIEASGGRARVSNPRTFATDAGFVPCVVAFFEGVDFLKPKNGKTVVSYSVRFTP